MVTLLCNTTKEYTALAVEIMYFKEMKHSSGLHSASSIPEHLRALYINDLKKSPWVLQVNGGLTPSLPAMAQRRWLD